MRETPVVRSPAQNRISSHNASNIKDIRLAKQTVAKPPLSDLALKQLEIIRAKWRRSDIELQDLTRTRGFIDRVLFGKRHYVGGVISDGGAKASVFVRATPKWRIPYQAAVRWVRYGFAWLRVRRPHIQLAAFPQRKWSAPGVCEGPDGWEKRFRLYLGRPSTAHYGPPYFYSRIAFERTWRTHRKPSKRWLVFDY